MMFDPFGARSPRIETPPRSHPLARAPLVDKACRWLEQSWRSGLTTRPVLDPDTLWRKAGPRGGREAEAGGRSEAEIADFRLRLDKLTQSLAGEAALNPVGLTLAHGQLVRAIRNRLKLGALWAARPELASHPIAPPIIVVGQMRSGTTRIHRLLASDPAHAGTRFCDSWHPCPPGRSWPDLRPLWSASSLLVARKLDPWLDAIHPFGAARADEELGWLAAALDHCAYEAQWRIPGFSAFSEARDPAPVYREFERILRTDAASRGNAQRRRVLKVPQFAEDIPALITRFPDALVVRTRRDLSEVAASAASLVANQMAIQSDHGELAWIEAECHRKIVLREARMDEALSGFDGALHEVSYDALGTDWRTQIAALYDGLGLTLSPVALAAMTREQDLAQAKVKQSQAALYRNLARA